MNSNIVFRHNNVFYFIREYSDLETMVKHIRRKEIGNTIGYVKIDCYVRHCGIRYCFPCAVPGNLSVTSFLDKYLMYVEKNKRLGEAPKQYILREIGSMALFNQK